MSDGLDDLKQYGLVYVATPYSKYPAGIEQAFIDSAKITARLLEHGIRGYSPICHTHPIAIHGKVDPYRHDIWLPFDEAIMGKCDAMVVTMMDTWERSKGIAHEIDFFTKADKPVFYLDPTTMELL